MKTPRLIAKTKRAWGLALMAMLPLSAWAAPPPQPGNPYAEWEHGPTKDAKFFPIAVWLQEPRNAKRFQDLGINLYVGLWQGPTAAQLAALKAAGMPVICEQNEVGLTDSNRDIVVGWMHGDEPDNAQSLGAGKGYGPPVKPSDIVASYQKLAAACDYPLHIGITEAGGLRMGTVKSSIGLGRLLWGGIGDTIRVSLSAPPVEEVKVGFDMLKALGLRQRGVSVISCPSCARQNFDVIKTVEALEQRLAHITTPMTLSVIGCVVNGPGEARETNVGLTGGGNNTHQIYLEGEQDHRLKDADIVEHLVKLAERKAAALAAAEK